MTMLVAGVSDVLGAILNLLHMLIPSLVTHFTNGLSRGSENMAWLEAPQPGRGWAPTLSLSLSPPLRALLDNECALFLCFFFSRELSGVPWGTWHWQGQELLLEC